MSFLYTIMEFMQNLCLEEIEISNIFKSIDEIHRENMLTENQLDELDREHVRLQIELSNLETITTLNQGIDIENVTLTTKKIYEGSMELIYLVNKIDYTKILQCHHMEMEAKFRREWEQIQERVVETLKRHDQMAQRHIVKKYNETEMVLRNAKDIIKSQRETMEKSSQQSQEVLNKKIQRRNEIIINLINGSKAINNIKKMMLTLKKYEIDINELKEEKLNLAKQLEHTQHGVFKPIFPLTNSRILLNSPQNSNSFNFVAPKLLSFTDILNCFNEKETKVTVIGNTSNVCVKSILHNPYNVSQKLNQSVVNKQTKHVRFNVQLEQYQTKEIESETDSDVSQKTSLEVVRENIMEQTFTQDSLQKESQIVDLLTPTKNSYEIVKEQQDATDAPTNTAKDFEVEESKRAKSPIEILECVTFKVPQPIKGNINGIDKENLLNISENFSSKQFSNTYSTPSTCESGKGAANNLNKSFYEEFINLSSSAENSPSNKPRIALKDFESYLNESRDILFSCKESIEDKKPRQVQLLFPQSKADDKKNNETEQDFLDFGNDKGFTFDSDDNVTANYNAADLDFM